MLNNTGKQILGAISMLVGIVIMGYIFLGMMEHSLRMSQSSVLGLLVVGGGLFFCGYLNLISGSKDK